MTITSVYKKCFIEWGMDVIIDKYKRKATYYGALEVYR